MAEQPDTCAAVRAGAGMLGLLMLLALLAGRAEAQELDPRAYSNLPTGLNFAIAGYAHSSGGLSTDPALPLEDASLTIHSGLFAYSRSFGLFGQSARVDMFVPVSSLSGDALVEGERQTREVSGLGDPRARLTFNFYGAPAVSPAEFAKVKRGLVAGASLQISAPFSQYDPGRLINLGTNRWSFKPEVGFSVPIGRVTFDMATSATFYTVNSDFFGGKSVAQDPVYAVQSNLTYSFPKGAWLAAGVTYYSGGRQTVDGVESDSALANSRAGLVMTFPVNRNHSFKANGSWGVATRTGTNFQILGLGWQYRWASAP